MSNETPSLPRRTLLLAGAATAATTVADGKYGWLNAYVYVGTLNSLRPEREAVVIRVYKVV